MKISGEHPARLLGGLAVAGATFVACASFSDESGGATGDAGSEDANVADATTSDGAAPADAPATITRSVVVLADGQNDLTGIAADESYVYWANNGAGIIRRVRLDASGTPEDVEPYGGAPGRVVVAGTRLLWSDQGAAKAGLYEDGVSGGSPSHLYSATPVNAFARRDDGVFALIGATDDYVRSYAPGGAGFAPLGPYGAPPVDVIADGNDLVWTASGDATVFRLASDAGSPEVLATPESDCGRLAKNQDGIYWTRAADNLVRHHRATGGPVVSLNATPEMGAYGLAADASGVYWLTTTGEVRKWTSATGTVETLATGQPIQDDANGRLRANNVALTKSYVVWTTSADVRRVEK